MALVRRIQTPVLFIWNRVEDPEILESDEESEEERPGRRYESDSEKDEENVDDDEIERKRAFLRQRALEKRDEEELLTKEEEKDSGSEEAESEYEEYTGILKYKFLHFHYKIETSACTNLLIEWILVIRFWGRRSPTETKASVCKETRPSHTQREGANGRERKTTAAGRRAEKWGT